MGQGADAGAQHTKDIRIEKQADRSRMEQTERQTDRQTYIRRNRQTDQADRETEDRQKDRTDMQTDRRTIEQTIDKQKAGQNGGSRLTRNRGAGEHTERQTYRETVPALFTTSK